MTDTTRLADEQLAEIRAYHERTTHPDWRDSSHVGQLLAEVDRLRAVEKAAYEFANEMGDYCSPHGVATVYADRLRERLDQAQPNRATDRARHAN